MRVRVVTPPQPIVLLDQAKQHLRVRHDHENDLIKAYVAAATGHIDGPAGWLRRSLGVQTLEARLDIAWSSDPVRLPFGPVLDLESIHYLEFAGGEALADLQEVELFGDELLPTGHEFPWVAGSLRRGALRIVYDAGYEEVPPAITAAILLMVEDLYVNRGTVASGMSVTAIPMSTTVENLLTPFRVFA